MAIPRPNPTMTKHVHMAPQGSVRQSQPEQTTWISFVAFTFLSVCAALMSFGYIGNIRLPI
jgi:hypothetical protein